MSQHLAVVACRIPALEHHAAALGPSGLQAWLDALLAQAQARAGAGPQVRREGEIVVVAHADRAEAVELALTLAAASAGGQGVAVGLGYGSCVVAGDEVFGPEVVLARRLSAVARVREVLCSPSAHADLPVPAGVGVFVAPAALSAALGSPIHVLRDYRDQDAT